MTMAGGGATAGELCKLKNRAWSKVFKILGVWGGEELVKIVEHIKGVRKKLQYWHVDIQGGQTCLNIPDIINVNF